jgi:hypothetical protein
MDAAAKRFAVRTAERPQQEMERFQMPQLQTPLLEAARAGHKPGRPVMPRRAPAEGESLAAKLERAIRRATGEKVRGLKVEFRDDRVIVHGRCGTFYCKQQVQQAVLALMKAQPALAREELDNRIRVW